MRFLAFIVEPNLKTILLAISIYWLSMVFGILVSEPVSWTTISFLLIYLLLFSGLWAKIKGFKIANGVSSICFIGGSIFGIFYFIKVIFETGLTFKIELLYIIPLIITLVLSSYTTYFLILNNNFTNLYKSKEDVSAFRRTLFKISLAIFILVISILTIYDLKMLRVF